MIRNYIKIAFRNLYRQKFYSLLNILGLTIGIACCLVIMLFVVNELSYEQHHTKADRIYRITQHLKWDGGSMNVPITSAPFAPALQSDYPAIENTVRLSPEGGGTMRVGDKQLLADDIFFADNSVFEIFDYKFLYGDQNTALQKSKSIVLTKELAEKLFADVSQAIGKSILFDNKEENIVTAIIDNPASNSHIRFSALRSLPPDFTSGWQEFSLYTYVLLKEGQGSKDLETHFPQFFDKYLAKEMGNADFQMKLQPITSIHLYSKLEYELGTNGDIKYVYLFATIALLLLLIACINYMNMATARSVQRAKEVGIRKTLGADKTHLRGLFIVESILVASIAVVLSILLADMSLPFVNNMMKLNLTFQLSNPIVTFVIACLLILIVGLISGSYPAFYLSSFNAISTLKGNLSSTTGKPVFRQALVTFQFVVSIILINCVWVVYQQLNYVNNVELGFNKDQTLSIHIHDEANRHKVKAIKLRLLQHSGVEAVATASNPIGANAIGKSGLFLETGGVMSYNNNQLAQHFMIDEDFLPTMEVSLLDGRNFEIDRATDHHEAVIINEVLAKQFGWDNPLGKRMKFANDTATIYKVIGVVKDFHVYSLQHQIEPLVMRLAPPKEQDNLYLRINTSDIPATMSYIKKAYSEFDNVNPYEAKFIDQVFAKQYDTVKQRGQLFLIFSGLALFIACLGLFGLAAFTAEQRTKEIGVRKVLGASVTNIISLLSKDFLKLVFIAIVIASPFAWYITHKWLEDFAYRININPLIFAVAGLVTIIVALATVSFQAFKAALANPVDSLRNE